MSASSILRESREQAGLSQRELAQRARTSQPAVQRYESGAVRPRVDTFERLLRACGSSAVVTLPLLGPIGYLVVQHRDEILGLAQTYGVRNVRVFGSVVRCEDTASSDLDLLVDLEEGRTALDVAGLTEDLRELLGVDVDVATVDLLKPSVRTSALASARRL